MKEKIQSLKLINRQLQMDLEYLNLLFETLPNPVFFKDKSGAYLGCNKAFESFYGKKRKQLIGKTVFDMGPREVVQKYYDMDQALLENGGTQHYEWVVVTAKKQTRYVIFDKAALVNAEGKISGLIGIITDITEKKESEEALKISEEKFNKISTFANDGIVQMDDEGRITFWNNAAQKIFGYTWEEVKGKDLHLLLAPKKYRSIFEKRFRVFIKYGKGPAINRTLELSGLRKDGSEFELGLSLSSYYQQGHWHAVGIVRDISHRKSIEKEREQLIEKLKTALDEIKTLQGIVPICAGCKKIRDDKGYWNQLETYIQQHSEAEFSHGICPDCAEKLYPGYLGKKK